MLTFFTLTMITLFDLTYGKYPLPLSELDIAVGVVFFGLEFLRFCGSFTKYVWTCHKNSIFEKIILENEKQARKIRFIIFILTFALIITVSKVFGHSLVCWYYMVFYANIDVDIACFLATQKERKQCWRELKPRLIFVIAAVVSLLVLYFFMDNIYSVFYRLIWSRLF